MKCFFVLKTLVITTAVKMRGSTNYVNKALCVLLGGVVLLLGVSLIHRSIFSDDAWLGEQAYWLSKSGHVKSELFRGLISYEVRQYFYHKLFIWIGAALISTFGFSLYVLKGLSLISLVGFVVLLLRFIKKEVPVDLHLRLLILIIILIHPLVFDYSFIFRPEIILMTTGFSSFILLYKSLHNKNSIYALFAGTLAGITCLLHLNGLAIAGAGLLTLLLMKDFRLAAFYILGGVVIVPLYFADISQLREIDMTVFQFRNDPALGKEEFSFWEHILKIFKEHKRLFWDFASGTFSILFIFACAMGYKGLKGEYKVLTMYTFFIVLILAGLAHSKTTKYMLIYLPYLWLVFLVCARYIYNERQFLLKYLYGGVALYICISVILDIRLISRNKNEVQQHAAIVDTYHLENQKIVAPMEFIYNEIESAEIQGTRAYEFFRERNLFGQKSQFDFYKVANHFNRTALVIKRKNFEEMELDIPSIGEVNGGFKLVDVVDNDFFIFKKVKEQGLR